MGWFLLQDGRVLVVPVDGTTFQSIRGYTSLWHTFILPLLVQSTLPLRAKATEKIGTGEALTRMSGIPAAVRNQPGTVLRECEASAVVDTNSRNARVFGARYWREG